MKEFHNNQPPVSGNLNFSPHPGIDITANVNKLSPEWKMVIGLGLLGLGFYQYYHPKKEEEQV